MRAHDKINVVAAKAQTGKPVHDVLASLHDRRHQPRQPAPARLGVFRHCRMAAGIEQHIGSVMANERARNRQFDGFALVGVGHKNTLAHAQPTTGEKMHFHHFSLALTTARIALTICS